MMINRSRAFWIFFVGGIVFAANCAMNIAYGHSLVAVLSGLAAAGFIATALRLPRPAA